MKQSGIDWIGEIPDDWKISKAKTILRNKSIKNHPDAEVLSLYRDLGIVPKNSRDDNHNVTSDDTASYKFVQKGELVLNKMKTWQGSLAVSDYEGIVSPAYYVCEFTNQEIDKKYIHYLLRNKMYAQEFERLSTGLRVGQWDLNIDNFLNTPIVYPPKKATQQRIAEYLDKKVSEIDSIIEESKKSIEEYKAWKQSVIFEAVTGKNLNCKKKDSGIEWIGEIPEKYIKTKLKYLLDIKGRIGFRGYTNADMVSEGEGAITLSPSNLKNLKMDFSKIAFVSWEKYNESPEIQIKIDDILFVKTGSSYGKSSLVNYLPIESTINPQLVVFKNIKCNKNFLIYYLQTNIIQNQVENIVIGGTIPTMSQEKMKNMFIFIPPLHEQETIAKMLDSKCAQIDSLIAEKELLITDLTEYKKSLIFEVVTGKRSV